MVWLRPDLSTGHVPLKPVSILDVGDSATSVDLPSIICYHDRLVYSQTANLIGYYTV
jgi:hypothetical protein